MKDFKELRVWEDAHQFVLTIYQLTQSFPKEEGYGIITQLRKAAASIPTNIAEGCGRDSIVELKRFCVIAMGSASEVEYQLLLARDLNYLSQTEYDATLSTLITVKKRLNAYIQFLKNRIKDE